MPCDNSKVHHNTVCRMHCGQTQFARLTFCMLRRSAVSAWAVLYVQMSLLAHRVHGQVSDTGHGM